MSHVKEKKMEINRSLEGVHRLLPVIGPSYRSEARPMI